MSTYIKRVPNSLKEKLESKIKALIPDAFDIGYDICWMGNYCQFKTNSFGGKFANKDSCTLRSTMLTLDIEDVIDFDIRPWMNCSDTLIVNIYLRLE